MYARPHTHHTHHYKHHASLPPPHLTLHTTHTYPPPPHTHIHKPTHNVRTPTPTHTTTNIMHPYPPPPPPTHTHTPTPQNPINTRLHPTHHSPPTPLHTLHTWYTLQYTSPTHTHTFLQPSAHNHPRPPPPFPYARLGSPSADRGRYSSARRPGLAGSGTAAPPVGKYNNQHRVVQKLHRQIEILRYYCRARPQ